jgi:predicted ATPase
MLRKWSLTNFKSFAGKTEIDLAPITVLAGANSSGKSTIIQSLLLLKQTLQYVPATRALGLNGPLLKLGKFDDIKNISSNSDTIEFGWEVDELMRYRSPNAAATFYSHHPARLDSAEFAIAFGLEPEVGKTDGAAVPRMTSNLRQLQPALLAMKVTANYSMAREGKDINASASLALERDSKHLSSAALPYRVTYTDPASKTELLQQRPESKLIGASLRHFFPNQVGVSFNKLKDFARKLAQAISTGAPERYFYDPEFRGTAISEQIVARLVAILTEVSSGLTVGIDNLARDRFLRRLHERLPPKEMPAIEFVERIQDLMRSDPRFRQVLITSIADRQEEIETAIISLAILPLEPGYDLGLPRMISLAAEQVTTFFQNSVRYLGPLRDEPRPVYPLEALVNLTDVGYRGEHTAAVLDLHKARPVTYIPSRCTNDLVDAQRDSVSLHEAVVDWLSYLGVAEGVRTEDMGMIGHQLQVRTGDVSRDHDLTNVGVGVSQLLPIIVMALLAPIPSLLIFEQPELHLHPKVQARLADFFLSLGLVGRQCILETHSEYLVDRLRRRIAESEGEKLNSQIKIYFTQKVNGNTECKPVLLTAYGAIKDWPSDFFDQSNNETELLLSAAQKKLKNERSAGGKK